MIPGLKKKTDMKNIPLDCTNHDNLMGKRQQDSYCPYVDM